MSLLPHRLIEELHARSFLLPPSLLPVSSHHPEPLTFHSTQGRRLSSPFSPAAMSTTNPPQLFLLADHIKLSLLERQRAISLNLSPNSQDGQISRSLDQLRSGIESLESQVADTPDEYVKADTPSVSRKLTTAEPSPRSCPVCATSSQT